MLSIRTSSKLLFKLWKLSVYLFRKNLDMSKLKEHNNDYLNLAETTKFVIDRVENKIVSRVEIVIVTNWQNSDDQHFLLSLQYFLNPFPNDKF